MAEDSAFFEQLTPGQMKLAGSVRLLHDSAGGWSQLYLADRYGRLRVLKALKPEFRGNPMYEELLRKEFEIGYTLSHPAVCEVYGFHATSGLGNCIEMEWVDGETLAALMARGGIPSKQAKRIFSQICSAVGYLHSRQIVHRDLKPANIMITHNGGNVKIIDFGLSDSDSFSILKAPAGTSSFAAPELIEGKTAGPEADIYSMGRILELMGIRCPATVARCTRKNPCDRYQEPSQIVSGMKRESFLRLVIPCVAMLLAAAALVWLFGKPGPDGNVPEENVLEDSWTGDSVTVDGVTVDTEAVYTGAQDGISVKAVGTEIVATGTATAITAGPAPAANVSDTVEIFSEEMIDELFRQATEMVGTAGGQ